MSRCRCISRAKILPLVVPSKILGSNFLGAVYTCGLNISGAMRVGVSSDGLVGIDGAGARCYDFSSLYPFTRLSRTVLSKPLFVLPVSSTTSPSSHYHASLLHHLPTWFPFTVISDSDSLCLPPYLPISDILYDTQTRCGRPFPGLSCI